MPIEKDYTNEKFNSWTVLYKTPKNKIKVKNKKGRWTCQCDCGFIEDKSVYIVIHNKSKSCGCLRDNGRYQGYESVSKSYFSRIIEGADKRNLKVTITPKNIWDLYIKQDKKCALSGVEVVFIRNYRSWKSGEQTASVDRIDSTKGYTLDNIQIVHKKVNFMKQELSDKEFIEWCTLIANKGK